jgi:arylsulfatase A
VLATVAAIIDVPLPDSAGEDSFNMLPAWRDPQHPPIRPYLLTQAFGGQLTLALRRGDWKYLHHTGSGGNRYEQSPELKPFILPEAAPDAPAQLYNLSTDPGETSNRYREEPQLVEELRSLLEQSLAAGRSRPVNKTDGSPSR